MKILGGIVLYNPEICRLKENIEAVLQQVDRLVLVDNGSVSKEYLSLADDPKIEVIVHSENRGIATALNTILQYALDGGFDWALTLDQDSVVMPNLIDAYKSVLSGKERLGLVCCKIHDRNATIEREEVGPHVDGYIEQCITSASMVNVEAWREIGGFDDAMFIDSVDFDFCIRLRKAGWRIFRTYKTILLHEVGHSKVIKIFGKEYLSLNHSPFRYYHIAKNLIYQGRKHGGLMRKCLVLSRTMWTILWFEEKKGAKLRSMCRGMVKGMTMPITRHEPRKKHC